MDYRGVSTMKTILVLTHVDDSGAALTKASLESVTAGIELSRRTSSPLIVGILGRDAEAAAHAVANTDARLLTVSGPAFAQARYATDAAACEALCRVANATVVLAPGSSRFARIAAGVAHRLGGCIDTHITALGGAESIEATRWFYRQRVEAVITRDARPWFLLLDAGTHAAYAGEPAEAEVEPVAVALPTLRTGVEGYREPMRGTQTIRPDAQLLFVAGAG
jgi:electron transfer flavoprotein alpha subunit